MELMTNIMKRSWWDENFYSKWFILYKTKPMNKLKKKMLKYSWGEKWLDKFDKFMAKESQKLSKS